MASRIYIRRLDNHCITHEISITTDVHRKVFLDQTEFDVIGKRSGQKGKIAIRMATDRRLGGDTKTVMKAELGDRQIEDGDILMLRSCDKNTYELEVFTPDDAEYVIFDDMCENDKHTIIAASANGPTEEIEVYQLIKFGVPGTGKSKGITDKIKETYEDYDEAGDNEFVFRTTLHPEYSYYDFVGSTYPVTKDGQVSYDFKPGIFTQALTKAFAPGNEHQKVFLVLEEMSRANVAAVFGDLFQLLDRSENGVSEYKIKNDLIADEVKRQTGVEFANNNIFIPSNLYIYGTVNTSDQNVFVMDNAFKRRFEFEYVGTEPVLAADGKYKNDYEFVIESRKYNWTSFYQRFNAYVTGVMGLREDKQIGPFFVKFRESASGEAADAYNYNQIKNKLLQFMWEDVHKCAMAEKPLFRQGINSFGEAYAKMEDHKNVFCDEFCDMFVSEEKEENNSAAIDESGESTSNGGESISDN